MGTKQTRRRGELAEVRGGKKRLKHGIAKAHIMPRRGANGAAIRVQSALGPGLLEDAFKLCLAHALRTDGHRVLREVYVDIEWEGLLVERAYRMDLVVDDRVVVEAKTVEKLVDAHFAQVNSQLRFSGFEVGLLLNFRQWPLKEGSKRVVHSRSSGFSTSVWTATY